ncbi:MAG: putative lipid II flippase FtsW [Candidatus Omnitrophota bacterium]|nr:putative lipid II flippase FtsW [Candidatus Omnitrophota bacterium]
MSSRQLRRALLIVVAALMGIGIVAVYSASALASDATYGGSLRFVIHHLLSIGCGLALGLGCLAIPYATLRRSARWLLLISLALLGLILVCGQEAGGARRWFSLGRWSIQPSEFAQLSLVLYLADLLARRAGELHRFWRGVVPPLLVVGLTSALVLLQPDLGTAIAMGAVGLLLLWVAKVRWSHLVPILASAAVGLAVLIVTVEYRRRRLFAFLNPWEDPLGSGYQIVQSYVSLASGGLVGHGVGASLQRLFFLPNAHTDFLFAIIGEELGLIGTTAVISLFALFLICGSRIAMAAQDLFSKYLVCGLVGMITFEAVVNIGVVTGLLPTKGLPLPLMSYGGSAMVMNLLACALIVQASRHADRPVTALPQ